MGKEQEEEKHAAKTEAGTVQDRGHQILSVLPTLQVKVTKYSCLIVSLSL